jgi:NAD(P)-dependent dehydrogenase (short-subunit alcohol dehydrogenase family)
VVPVAADVGSGDAYLDHIAAAADVLGGISGLLFPIGAVSPNDDGSLDPHMVEWLTRVNFLSVVSAVARFLLTLRSQPRATIVGFGTVAATRGRSVNTVYSAAKRALESYFESLRYIFADSNVRVQFYVLGYLDTNLAFGIPTLIPKANPDILSARVLRNLERNIGVVYYPAFWRFACAVLRQVPWVLFKYIMKFGVDSR